MAYEIKMCLCVMSRKRILYVIQPRTSYYIPIYIYNCNVVLLLTLWYFHSISYLFFLLHFRAVLSLCVNSWFENKKLLLYKFFHKLVLYGIIISLFGWDCALPEIIKHQQEVEDQFLFFCYKPQVTIKKITKIKYTS